ncbi:hypothetical protein [Streptomyces oceani]|uniref:Uncharacterized protein n=1 Tax=Streptomyces oceani TaxID=1075402 RepID=A0A1E7KIY7_9ACTN|nr:hypothetical protein [Streptomyces oceani]OEV03900.1 hypothetical protein AN216_09655 [Streptomyces oceani]
MSTPPGRDSAPAADPRRDTTKRTYGFAEWPGRDGAPLSGLFLPEHRELPGLTFDRRHPLPDTRAFLDQLVGPSGQYVSVWVHQYPTAGDAHEALVDQLLTSMAPRLPRCTERGLEAIGDVCFCGLADPVASVLFVRANVLVTVEDLGDTHAAVTEVATELDRQITLST